MVIAAQGANNSLKFYWQQIGSTGWTAETVARVGTIFSAPSLAVNGGGVNIAVFGVARDVDFYWENSAGAYQEERA